ncbi:MAG TPA: YdeI/OmpD-associated family protein [Actinomycetes bacterium]|nr:YdeI/OmpD-associated family protein [Actinomycetes bacterium]
MQPQRFTATLAPGSRGGVFVPVPFDPDQVWRAKPRHHVTGTINGMGIRAVIEGQDDQRGFTMGPAWLRGCTVAAGDTVTVEIVPEGPQRDDLADDVATALDANPQAGAFFDSLAQFYRNAYLRWIDGTKRKPELRAQRIAEMIRLLETGVKERPKS